MSELGIVVSVGGLQIIKRFDEYGDSEDATPSSGPVDSAFNRLFLTERLPMIRLATLVIGSPAQAEDVVQEAFAKVSSRWNEIENHGGYLRTAVVNGSRAIVRRRGVETRYLESKKVVADIESYLPDHLVELEQALRKLNERSRTVIVLRHLLGLTDQEIAETMEITPSGVRSIASRAFKVMRKELR